MQLNGHGAISSEIDEIDQQALKYSGSSQVPQRILLGLFQSLLVLEEEPGNTSSIENLPPATPTTEGERDLQQDEMDLDPYPELFHDGPNRSANLP